MGPVPVPVPHFEARARARSPYPWRYGHGHGHRFFVEYIFEEKCEKSLKIPYFSQKKELCSVWKLPFRHTEGLLEMSERLFKEKQPKIARKFKKKAKIRISKNESLGEDHARARARSPYPPARCPYPPARARTGPILADSYIKKFLKTLNIL